MSCFICHRSRWMREKALTFLENILKSFENYIGDDDIFKPLDCGEVWKKLKVIIHLHSCKTARISNSSLVLRKELVERALDDERSVSNKLIMLWNDEIGRKIIKLRLPEIMEAARKHPWGIPEEEDLFQKRFDEIQRLLTLTDIEKELLLFLFAWDEDIIADPDTIYMGGSTNLKIILAAMALDLSEIDVLQLVTPKRRLRRYRCIDEDLDICSDLRQFMGGFSDEPLETRYFKEDTATSLPWKDFADLTKKHGAILQRLLTSGDKPVNILLYGAPGTGKTSFARALAAKVGKKCYDIAQNTNDSTEATQSTPEFRFSALNVCDNQIEPKESVIIVDEADDMLRGNGSFMDGSRHGDKGLLNRVLDEIKTSTIWITNTEAEELEESSRRRFDYSICFEPLNCEQRKQIWKNNIARLKMGRFFTGKVIEEYATLYPVSAGGISQTLENLERMHPKKAEISPLIAQLMTPHCELMGIRLSDDKLLPSKDYSLDGLNLHGEVKLERIIEAVRSYQRTSAKLCADRPRMNLLLSGAPGTGKTEFVKYLASVLKTKVNVKMGSDMLSCWVGETEQNIKQAFMEASAENAILFLDEIDGLVQSRTNAHHSWEVTQVNELLYQMENFNGIMIGATNFIQNLDQAIMRRFTFKLEFDFLDRKGKVIFFERMFKSPLTEAERSRLVSIPNLAPGDFRTVRQSLFYYGGEITNAMRLDALEREANAKNYGAFANRNHIGF